MTGDHEGIERVRRMRRVRRGIDGVIDGKRRALGSDFKC